MVQSQPVSVAPQVPTSMAGGTTAPSTTKKNDAYWVYVGTYTDKIYRFKFEDGALTQVGTTKGSQKPSFLAVHPENKFLYAANEVASFGSFKSGAVSAYSIDAKTGALTHLNDQPSGGLGPCHLSVDGTGKFILVTNYQSGSTAILPINTDGSLGKPSSVIKHKGKGANPRRQSVPHAHYVQTDADNDFVLVPDLGADKLFIYSFNDVEGIISAHASVSVKPGSGPRHFAMHPNGTLAFLLNELRSTINVYEYDKGTLTEVQTISTLPAGAGGNSAAEIVVHPNGKFLYSSNRGHNSIAMFSLDEATGMLTAIGHEPTNGEIPRNFNIDPSGEFLIVANQSSGTLHVFSIDQATGKLTATNEIEKAPTPVCVKFVPIR
jgi:6-phosphogluconolactonase